MVPCAYLFVKEELDRYENYTSTLFEYFTLSEVKALSKVIDEALDKATEEALNKDFDLDLDEEDLDEAIDEAINKAMDIKVLKHLPVAMSVMQRFCKFYGIFVIYNPDVNKMFMAKLAEADMPIMLVDTQEKADRLEHYEEVFNELDRVFSDAHDLKHFDFDSLFQHKKNGYEESVEHCNTSINKYVKNLTSLIDLWQSNFKKEFIF